MGCCLSKVKDPNAPTCPPDNYPRNPAYANQYNDNSPAPIALPPRAGYGGDGFLTGAAVGYVAASHGVPDGIHGAMAPEMYNPLSGGYDML